MDQMSLTSAHSKESPTGEALLSDLPDPYTKGSIMSEQVAIGSKACGCATQVRMPIVDERCSVLGMCPDLWSSLGVVNVDRDTCIGSV
jgi:hypothetical protein